MTPAARDSASFLAVVAWLRKRPWAAALSAAGVVATGVSASCFVRTAADDLLTAVVERGTLRLRVTVSGVLRPAQSITYRSPLGGREAEITFLVAEGTLVNEGDLLARIDTTEVQRDVERAVQDLRQAQVDLHVADTDLAEAQAAIESLVDGDAALTVDETRTRLQLAEKRVERLREAHNALSPLLDQGFITRDELRKTADELEQAEEDLALARRRSQVLLERTYPRDRKRAELQLAQKEALRENIRARLAEADARVRELRGQLEASSIYARRPGLVVYEEYLNATPRRKIRAGDRVTASQGLITIPEVNRMIVEASVGEADVRRVRPGQPARVRLEAFPDRELSGTVTRIGTLARNAGDRLYGEKRFDLVVDVDRADADLRPEMTARVDVLLGDRQDVLLVPVNAVFTRQGVPVVHVVGRFGVETRPVQVGESDGTSAEVRGDVAVGDRVALSDIDAARPAGAGPATVREDKTRVVTDRP